MGTELHRRVPTRPGAWTALVLCGALLVPASAGAGEVVRGGCSLPGMSDSELLVVARRGLQETADLAEATIDWILLDCGPEQVRAVVRGRPSGRWKGRGSGWGVVTARAPQGSSDVVAAVRQAAANYGRERHAGRDAREETWADSDPTVHLAFGARAGNVNNAAASLGLVAVRGPLSARLDGDLGTGFSGWSLGTTLTLAWSHTEWLYFFAQGSLVRLAWWDAPQVARVGAQAYRFVSAGAGPAWRVTRDLSVEVGAHVHVGSVATRQAPISSVLPSVSVAILWRTAALAARGAVPSTGVGGRARTAGLYADDDGRSTGTREAAR